jgi:hypothetical protein
MLSQFTKIAPNDPNFLKLETELSTLNDRFDYDGLAKALDGSEVGGIIQFEYPEGKMSVIAKQLEKRGLQRSLDFVVQAAEVGGKNNVYVKKLTTKASQAVVVKKREKPAAAAGATGAAAAGATGAADATAKTATAKAK